MASGPSLTKEALHQVRMTRWERQWNVLMINDCYKVAPWADALYACDNAWWNIHGNCFKGQKWACHQDVEANNKLELAEKLDLNLVSSKDGDYFSLDPSVICHGSNSGFQAVNLALHFGCKFIVLVGFDMRCVNGSAHFFGRHPDPLGDGDDNTYRKFANAFARAAPSIPSDVTIINATPNSALTCFPMMPLSDAIERYDSLHRYRAIAHA
jgi:hypothetical protein